MHIDSIPLLSNHHQILPPFSSSLRRLARVLLLMPLSVFLNCLYLTGLVEQQSGIKISSLYYFFKDQEMLSHAHNVCIHPSVSTLASFLEISVTESTPAIDPSCSSTTSLLTLFLAINALVVTFLPSFPFVWAL
jgi:hypothetical protein